MPEQLTMSAAAGTCAIHDVVINNIHEKMTDLYEGQKEVKVTLDKNHAETIQHILQMAQLHRDDIKAFKVQIYHDFEKLQKKYDMHLEKTDAALSKIKIRIAQATAAALALGGAAGFFFKYLNTILMVFK